MTVIQKLVQLKASADPNGVGLGKVDGGDDDNNEDDDEDGMRAGGVGSPIHSSNARATLTPTSNNHGFWRH